MGQIWDKTSCSCKSWLDFARAEAARKAEELKKAQEKLAEAAKEKADDFGHKMKNMTRDMDEMGHNVDKWARD